MVSVGPVIVRKRVEATRLNVWAFFVEARQRHRWWADSHVDPRVDGAVSERWSFGEGDELESRNASGKVDVFVPGHALGFRWRDGDDEHDTAVLFTLHSQGENTDITVLETGFGRFSDAGERAADAEQGWIELLDYLAAAVVAPDPILDAANPAAAVAAIAGVGADQAAPVAAADAAAADVAAADLSTAGAAVSDHADPDIDLTDPGTPVSDHVDADIDLADVGIEDVEIVDAEIAGAESAGAEIAGAEIAAAENAGAENVAADAPVPDVALSDVAVAGIGVQPQSEAHSETELASGVEPASEPEPESESESEPESAPELASESTLEVDSAIEETVTADAEAGVAAGLDGGTPGDSGAPSHDDARSHDDTEQVYVGEPTGGVLVVAPEEEELEAEIVEVDGIAWLEEIIELQAEPQVGVLEEHAVADGASGSADDATDDSADDSADDTGTIPDFDAIIRGDR